MSDPVFDNGPHPSFHVGHSHGEAPGSGHPQGQADRRHRRVRLRQDHPGLREPCPRAGGSPPPEDRLPAHVKLVKADGIGQVKLIDATPIGINVRSTVATYANVHDELRKIYARHTGSKGRTASRPAISPTTPGNCAARSATARAASAWTCSSLPDVDIPCPACRGARYAQEAGDRSLIRLTRESTIPCPDLMAMDVHTALKRLPGYAAGPPTPAGAAGSRAWATLPSARKRRACPAGRHSA